MICYKNSKNNYSVVFNSTCIKENLLPTYTNNIFGIKQKKVKFNYKLKIIHWDFLD